MSTIDLPEFNDEARCPKCGGEYITAIYRRDGHEWGCQDHRPYDGCCTFEHIDRTCQRCDYTWPEGIKRAPGAGT